MSYAGLHKILEPKYDNKAQEIYHSLDRKHSNRSEEFIKVLKHTFIDLCLEDNYVDDFKDIMKPPPRIGY